MDLVKKLRDVVLKHWKNDEFPIRLLTDILEIADTPDSYADRVHLVEILIAQISDYDSYAGAGCFGTSVGAGTIQATIDQIKHNDIIAKKDANYRGT